MSPASSRIPVKTAKTKALRPYKFVLPKPTKPSVPSRSWAAAELRGDAQTSRGVATERVDGCHSESCDLRSFVEGKLEAAKHLARTVHACTLNPCAFCG